MLSPPLLVLCPSEWTGWLSRLGDAAVRPVTIRGTEKICRTAKTIEPLCSVRRRGELYCGYLLFWNLDESFKLFNSFHFHKGGCKILQMPQLQPLAQGGRRGIQMIVLTKKNRANDVCNRITGLILGCVYD